MILPLIVTGKVLGLVNRIIDRYTEMQLLAKHGPKIDAEQ